jgi:hypothetical protein
MSSILITAAPAHFLAGLALFTLSAMICSAFGRAVTRPQAAWGLSAMIALALAEWSKLADGGSTRPLIWQWAGLAFELVALAALIELGRFTTPDRRTGFLPRWSYEVVVLLALIAVLLGGLNPLQFALRLAILWQAGWLAFVYLTRGQTIAIRVIVGALLVYLAAAAVAIPALGMLAALVAVGAAFLAFAPGDEKSRSTKLVWRCAWPTAFVLIAAGGCFALRAPGENGSDVLLAELSLPADQAASDDLANADFSSDEADDQCAEAAADYEDAATSSELARQAKRYGLGISPIILFVLFVWGLSRLPFMH